MPLQLTVDSLENVPEALHGEYEQDGDKFKLKVEGIERFEGLEKALENSRRVEREARNRIAKWEALGKTDEEIAEMLKAAEEADHKRAEESGDHAKILKQHQDKWAKERADLEAELNAARTSERSAIIGTSVMTALTKAGATEEGIDLLPDRLAARITFETTDGKRVLRIMQADGETPMAGTGKEGLATFDDLVKEASSKWPSLFKGSGNSGSGKQPGNGAHGNGKIDPRLGPVERINAARAAGGSR